MVSTIGLAIVCSSLAAGGVGLGLVWYLFRYRGQAGAGWFIGSLIAQSVWTIAYGAGLMIFDPTLRAVAEAVAWIGMNCTGPLFFAFTLVYTGRSTFMRRRWLAVLGLSPAATMVLVVSQPWVQLLWQEFRISSVFELATALYAIQPLGYVTVILSLTMAGAGVLLLVETMLSYGSLYRRETAAIILSPLPATVPLLLWLSRLGPYPALNLTPALLLTHVALDGYAFSRTHMFESNPRTRRAAERSAVDNLEHPLLVLDTAGTVVRLNDQAITLFGTPAISLPATVESLLGEDLTTLTTAGEIEIGSRIYAVSQSSLTTAVDETVGSVLVFYDITTERRQRQRLSVLNRVLRHNLRNEMTVMQGHADALRAQWDDQQLQTQSTSIIDAGDRLLSIANKIRNFEQTQTRPTKSDSVEPQMVVEQAQTTIERDHPSATVTTTGLDDAPSIRTDAEILILALTNVLDNAVRYSDAPTPTVKLGLSVTDEAITWTIQDTNPRIPSEELAPLETTEEAPLRHGSGIGLWIVQWSVETLGGSVQFAYDDGNVVTIILPRTT